MDPIFAFPVSAFPPLAVGFFGLGTGYLIYGPQELIPFPKRTRTVDIGTGIWGVWMPGFMQFITGTYLFVGLVWFHSMVAGHALSGARLAMLQHTFVTGLRAAFLVCAGLAAIGILTSFARGRTSQLEPR